MTRALLLPLTAILALATGAGMLGVATTLTQEAIVLVTATAVAVPTLAPAIVTPTEAALPTTDPLVAHIPVQLATGPVVLSVVRLTLRPDKVLPPAGTTDPTILLVESGAVAVQIASADLVRRGLDEAPFDAVLHRGQQVVVHAGMIHSLRNAGEAPAVVLVLTIAAQTTASDPHQTGPPP